jgi:hypothetical protein
LVNKAPFAAMMSGGSLMNVGSVDRYKIRAPLRCDGVGSLDCAEDIESGMRMAIRWLPLEANGGEAVKTVEKLPVHPRLPKICGTGQVGSAAYVAMEFPEGKLLSTLLNEPLTSAEVRQLGGEMADALASVHHDGALHGELSADSILMLPGGRAILWDVPLVIANRLTDRRGQERFMRQLLHMATFIAPERARGAAASPASDVYALAAVLCVAGGTTPPPEADESTLALVHRIATGEWTPEIPLRMTDEVRAVLKRMLVADAALRPSAREVAQLFSAPPAAVEAPPSANPMAATIKISPADLLSALTTAPHAVQAPVPAEPSAVVAPPPVRPAAAKGPVAVVAPSIEISTDQIKPGDVRTIEREEPLAVPELGDDEFDFEPRRPPIAWALVAGFGALLLGGSIAALINYPRGPRQLPVAAIAQPPARPATVAPAASADPSPEDGLIQPLAPPARTASSKRVRAPAKRRAPVVRPQTAAAPAPAAAPADRDFSFLSTDAQAPKDQLKHP